MVDRDSGIGLVEQVEASLRTAILSRKYESGQALPGMISLAEAYGVSEKTTRRALQRLAVAGWVRPVRGVGSVVCERSGPRDSRGRVLLCFASAHDGYYFIQLRQNLERRLKGANYQLSVVTTSAWLPDDDLSDLKRALSEPWDLVIESGYEPSVRRLVEQAGQRFLSVGSGARIPSSTALGCAATIQVLMGLGLPDFYRRAAQLNVRRVWQFSIGKGGFDISGPLSAQGIRTENFRIDKTKRRQPRAALYALETIHDRLARGLALPDVVFFGDDHFCEAGLIALMAHGVRIPEDVRVVTFALRGNEPLFTRKLSQLVLDPRQITARIATSALAILQGRPVAREATLGSCWAQGETF